MRELTEAEKETIYLSLLHLGVVHWTKGSKRMELAMRYMIQREDVSDMQALELYADVAKMSRCKCTAIERSLRPALTNMWRDYGLECSRLFFHSTTLVERPQVSKFVYLYKREFENGSIQRWNESIATPLDLSAYKEHEADIG
jgi:hypothetical protein